MAQDSAGAQIVERIGFAERWLDRARTQIGGGNVARGALTLVLADAEVRHALEVAGLRSARPRRGAAAAVAAALLLIAAGAALVFLPRGTAPLAGERAAFSAAPERPVVTLGVHTGMLLRIVGAPHPEAAPPAARSAPGRPLRAAPAPTPVPRLSARPEPRPAPVTVAPRPGPSPVPVTAAPLPAAPQAPEAAAQPVTVVPPTVQAAPLTLTAGELIDLVLAAERTLRGDPRR